MNGSNETKLHCTSVIDKSHTHSQSLLSLQEARTETSSLENLPISSTHHHHHHLSFPSGFSCFSDSTHQKWLPSPNVSPRVPTPSTRSPRPSSPVLRVLTSTRGSSLPVLSAGESSKGAGGDIDLRPRGCASDAYAGRSSHRGLMCWCTKKLLRGAASTSNLVRRDETHSNWPILKAKGAVDVNWLWTLFGEKERLTRRCMHMATKLSQDRIPPR